LGGINGEDQAKNVGLDLGFLGDGRFQLDLIADGGDARSFGGKTMTVESGSAVRIAVRPFGGFTATINPTNQ
jgi:hypothetical protein